VGARSTTVVDTEVIVTDMQQGLAPQRRHPDRPVRVQQGWVAAGGAIALVGFFLPWVKSWMSFGLELGSNSGFTFAKTTDSVASGNSLAILWISLIAAVLALASAAYAGFVHLDTRSYKGVTGIQAVIAIAGIAVIWMTLPGEIDTWTGLVIEYQPGLWITVVGLAVAGVGGVVGLAAKRAD